MSMKLCEEGMNILKKIILIAVLMNIFIILSTCTPVSPWAETEEERMCKPYDGTHFVADILLPTILYLTQPTQTNHSVMIFGYFSYEETCKNQNY